MGVLAICVVVWGVIYVIAVGLIGLVAAARWLLP